MFRKRKIWGWKSHILGELWGRIEILNVLISTVVKLSVGQLQLSAADLFNPRRG